MEEEDKQEDKLAAKKAEAERQAAAANKRRKSVVSRLSVVKLQGVIKRPVSTNYRRLWGRG